MEDITTVDHFLVINFEDLKYDFIFSYCKQLPPIPELQSRILCWIFEAFVLYTSEPEMPGPHSIWRPPTVMVSYNVLSICYNFPFEYTIKILFRTNISKSVVWILQVMESKTFSLQRDLRVLRLSLDIQIPSKICWFTPRLILQRIQYCRGFYKIISHIGIVTKS